MKAKIRKKQLWRNLCFCLFYPTETPSVSLLKEEPLEVMESPEPLTKSVGELPESTAVIQEPVYKTTKPPPFPMDDVREPAGAQ